MLKKNAGVEAVDKALQILNVGRTEQLTKFAVIASHSRAAFMLLLKPSLRENLIKTAVT